MTQSVALIDYGSGNLRSAAKALECAAADAGRAQCIVVTDDPDTVDAADRLVLTGAISSEEIARRASIGFFLFVPRGLDEALLKETGFLVLEVADRTRNMAQNADGWLAARQKREAELRRIEGDEAFEGQQRFLETTALLAREGRLSRLAILAQAR